MIEHKISDLHVRELVWRGFILKDIPLSKHHLRSGVKLKEVVFQPSLLYNKMDDARKQR